MEKSSTKPIESEIFSVQNADSENTNKDSLTRSKLIKALFDQSNQLKQKDIELAIKIILEQMSDTLANGQRIEIRGFGSFSLRHHAARIGRNPRSSQPVRIAAKYVPHFKPGKSLRDRVNQTPLPKKDPPSP